MDLKKINEKLTELFAKHRVVFWNDANEDFKDELTGCLPSGVEALQPGVLGQFKTKVVIEVEKPSSKFLVYSPTPEPRAEEDWLLDIRLYGYQFRADASSMLVEELGLKHHQLREHIAKRAKFFSSKQRLMRLKSLIGSNDREREIDRKLLTVLVKAENDRFFDIIHAIFDAFPFDQGLDATPDAFAAIEKMDLANVFWDLVHEAFGYKEDKPNIRHLMTCLFVSDLYLSIGDCLCHNVRQFILPSGSARNAAVCLSEWRNNVKMTESYDRLSEMLADALGIERYLQEIPFNTPEEINRFKDAVTFSATERIATQAIKAYVLGHEDTLDKDFVLSFCRHRQASHWSNKKLGEEVVSRESFYAVYEALAAAAEFMAKKLAFPQGFSYAGAKEIFDAYVTELHFFDRYYRLFYEHAYTVDAKGWEILKDIKSRMEDLYNNWFLLPITMRWEEKARVDNWRIDDVNNQYDFFRKYPEPKAGDKSAAVFVVISDALRFETGSEIAEILNGKFRFAAKKEAMLGVVPSYTALGMAALLPHSKIAYSAKGDVLIDGKSCAGTAQRDEILATQKGMAIKGDDLVRMGREEARELVREKNVVYLYHNTIDAIGDDAKTEHQTFTAVRRAVDEVCNMVSYAVNNLHAKYVFITADHGFVYTESRPGETERNKVALSDKDFAVLKKRYSLGKNVPALDYVHQGIVSNTAGVGQSEDMQFAIPKGMSLFYFTGGSRYFHGGISLQEVVVPVITVEQIRGKDREKTRDKYVGVQVLGQDHRITTGKHRFEILQIEAVSERVRPATFKIGVYAEGEPVSDIQPVSFESISPELADRKREVVLTLKNVDFPAGKVYTLILRNAETDIEEQAIPVRIDRVFTSDF